MVSPVRECAWCAYCMCGSSSAPNRRWDDTARCWTSGRRGSGSVEDAAGETSVLSVGGTSVGEARSGGSRNAETQKLEMARQKTAALLGPKGFSGRAPRELSGPAASSAAGASPPASLALGQDRRKCFWIAGRRPVSSPPRTAIGPSAA